jgi:hypothetical protein
MSFLTSRTLRVAAGLAALSAIAVAPMAAQAADTPVTGTLSSGGLTNLAPPIAAFNATLTGFNQTVNTTVGAWNVTDATGSNAGYNVTVAATAPTVAGGNAGTGGSITLTPATATAADGNVATTGPVARPASALTTTASTIEAAGPGTGQGQWNFAGDSDAAHSLSVVIPGDASAGDYSSTLTFTAAPLAVA